MDTPTQASIQLTQQGVSLLFQQGVAFVALIGLIAIQLVALWYVVRLYKSAVDKVFDVQKEKDNIIEKYYQAALDQTKVLANFTESLRDVIRTKS